MKKFLLSLLFILSSLAVLFAAGATSLCKAEKYFADGGGSNSYVNSCPGAQGHRQSQVVACRDSWFGEKQVQGCCQGGGACYKMNPCGNHEDFRCGNSGWCSAE